MEYKKGVSVLWIMIILVIIGVGVFFIFFWKDSNINNPQNESIAPINENIGSQGSSSEPSNDNLESNDNSNESTNKSTEGTAIDWGSGGGGGGGAGGGGSGGSSTTTTAPENVETFSSLEELFNSGNPVGSRVSVYGIAFPIAGVSTADRFFFTDDSRVMSDPNYLLFNDIEYHITVYNSLNVEIPQSIITLTGTIVDCDQNDDGVYCVDAESIE